MSIAGRCSVSGPLLRKVESAVCDEYALEDVDTPVVDQVRADRDVEAANCPASLFDYRYKQPSLLPAKADPQAQAAWVETYTVKRGH